MGFFERFSGRGAKREATPSEAPLDFPASRLVSESAADSANSGADITAASGETEGVAIDSAPVVEGPATGDGARQGGQDNPDNGPLADEGEPEPPSPVGDGDDLMDIFTSEPDEEDVDLSPLTHSLGEIDVGSLLEEATRVSARLRKLVAGEQGPGQGAG